MAYALDSRIELASVYSVLRTSYRLPDPGLRHPIVVSYALMHKYLRVAVTTLGLAACVLLRMRSSAFGAGDIFSTVAL
jgi:hypothetical protein